MKKVMTAVMAMSVSLGVWADGLSALKGFVSDVKSGKAAFTQTVTSPDGLKTKTSQGTFEFQRPQQFRFEYAKPNAQLIVGDGRKVWLHDIDLDQVTVRNADAAVGATPAALLAGSSIDKEFQLRNLPGRDGLEWVEAVPRQKESSFKSVRIGLRGKDLAVLEIDDHFGQKSRLVFSQVVSNAPLAADRFKFVPPKGVDVVQQ